MIRYQSVLLTLSSNISKNERGSQLGLKLCSKKRFLVSENLNNLLFS